MFEAEILYISSVGSCCVSVFEFRAIWEDIAYVIVGQRPPGRGRVAGPHMDVDILIESAVSWVPEMTDASFRSCFPDRANESYTIRRRIRL